MTRLAVPWYVRPAEAPSEWQRLVALGDRVEFAVLNVADRPGHPGDPRALTMQRETALAARW